MIHASEELRIKLLTNHAYSSLLEGSVSVWEAEGEKGERAKTEKSDIRFPKNLSNYSPKTLSPLLQLLQSQANSFTHKLGNASIA
jgi:hypothetical protein